MTDREEDLDKPQFEFKAEIPEIGRTYPVYGMITEIISEKPLVIRVNNQLEGTCLVEDQDKIDLVKSRSMEPGIFITTFEGQKEDGMYFGTVKTIVFGRKQHTEFDA
jgi:hypothetical protein